MLLNMLHNISEQHRHTGVLFKTKTSHSCDRIALTFAHGTPFGPRGTVTLTSHLYI